MVDRVRDQDGDPRFFLAELKKNTEPSIAEDYLVFVHRQPYMKMDAKQRQLINVCVFLLMQALCFVWNYSYNALNIFITIQTPFDLFMIPGLFYYWRYLEQWKKEEVNVE